MKDQSPEKSCKQYADLLSAWLDGQLTEEQSAAVESHLQSCPQCTKQVNEYRILQHLINAEKQKSPVDLTTTVMAGLEREQLLHGLDELAKPPTPRRVKLLRTFAAAAMIGLIVYAGSLISQFAGSSQKSKTASVDAYKSITDVSAGKAKRKLRQSTPTIVAKNRISDPEPSSAAKDTPTLALAPRESSSFDDKATRSETLRTESNTTQDKTTAPSVSNRPPLVSQPSQPVTKPTETQNSDLASAQLPAITGLPQVKRLDQQIPLQITFSTPDLPSLMLLKEQVFEVLAQGQINRLLDSDQVHQALKSDREFFYQAKKGLDLLPGSSSTEILLRVSPEKITDILLRIQQTTLEAIVLDIHPELRDFLKTHTLNPTLSNLVQKTTDNLNHYFDHSGNDFLIAEVPDQHPTSSPTTTQTTQTATQPQTAPAQLALIPVLLEIKLQPRITTTTTTTTSAPSTQPTQTAPATQPSPTTQTTQPH